MRSEGRHAIATVRETILANLPGGYEEAIALASQKNHMAVYLSAIYIDDEARRTFEAEYQATGKRYDVGKSCVRFKRLEDLPVEVIGEAIARVPVERFIERCEAGRASSRRV